MQYNVKKTHTQHGILETQTNYEYCPDAGRCKASRLANTGMQDAFLTTNAQMAKHAGCLRCAPNVRRLCVQSQSN